MQQNFDAIIDKVFEHEGGYGNHPADPGGPTNWGITKAVYEGYLGRKVTIAEVRAITKPIAKAIYRKNYWDKVRGDDLPSGIDYTVMDFAVNSGVSRSGKRLQKMVGAEQDGQIGDKTLDALKVYLRTNSASKLITEFNDGRLAWIKTLNTWGTFGRGWERRVVEVKRDSLALASGSTPVTTVAPAPAPAPLGRTTPTPPIAGSGNSIVGTSTAVAATAAAAVAGASGGSWGWLIVGAVVIALIVFRKKIFKLIKRGT